MLFLSAVLDFGSFSNESAYWGYAERKKKASSFICLLRHYAETLFYFVDNSKSSRRIFHQVCFRFAESSKSNFIYFICQCNAEAWDDASCVWKLYGSNAVPYLSIAFSRTGMYVLCSLFNSLLVDYCMI